MNKHWEALKQPPDWALKTIGGGRLKGMTDISPQWRYHAMTEEFGLCGIGWKYEVNRTWTAAGSHEQVMAFAEVSLYVKDGDEWSAAIPGIGGNMLVVKESAGLHTSDEGYKMAVTDALSVAMKMIGVGASVYYGEKARHWDMEQSVKYISHEQSGVLLALVEQTGTTEEAVLQALKTAKSHTAAFPSFAELPEVHHAWVLGALNTKAKRLADGAL